MTASCASFPPILCSYSSPQGWEKVTTLKKGHNGIYITDPKTNLFSQKSCIVDSKTGDLYWDESQDVIAEKCFRIFLGTPFYIAGVMGWNFAKAFIDPVRLGFNSAVQFAKDVKDKNAAEAISALIKRSVVEIPKASAQAIGADLWDVVRAPFYGLAMMFSALYGIYDPYVGREYEARVEHALMHNISYKEDFRTKKREAVKNCWPEFIYGIQNAQAFYLAYCFQIRGNINDPSIHVMSRQPI